MTETTAPAATGIEAQLEAFGKSLLAQILPMVDAAAKSAVTAALPSGIAVVAAPVADLVIDYVDAEINKLTGIGSTTVTTPDATEDRVTALEKHVAALTVSSGAATSSVHATTLNATGSNTVSK